MTVKKPIPKLLLPPITTREDCAMNQSEVLAITHTCSRRGKKRANNVQLVLAFAFHWLKNCLEIFKPIAERKAIAIE